jgi:non-canonical (house-cleaning) NTP pyrophosphatase
MKKVVILSESLIKISLVKDVISHFFPNDEIEYISLALEKDGPEPFGDEEIIKQATESIAQAISQISDASFYIGMEGGMVDIDNRMVEIAKAVIQDNEGNVSISNCTTFDVPPAIAKNVRKGADFAESVDLFFKTKGTKLGGGYFSILTAGLVTKKDHYTQAVASALGKLVHKEWYEEDL